MLSHGRPSCRYCETLCSARQLGPEQVPHASITTGMPLQAYYTPEPHYAGARQLRLAFMRYKMIPNPLQHAVVRRLAAWLAAGGYWLGLDDWQASSRLARCVQWYSCTRKIGRILQPIVVDLAIRIPPTNVFEYNVGWGCLHSTSCLIRILFEYSTQCGTWVHGTHPRTHDFAP